MLTKGRCSKYFMLNNDDDDDDDDDDVDVLN